MEDFSAHWNQPTQQTISSNMRSIYTESTEYEQYQRLQGEAGGKCPAAFLEIRTDIILSIIQSVSKHLKRRWNWPPHKTRLPADVLRGKREAPRHEKQNILTGERNRAASAEPSFTQASCSTNWYTLNYGGAKLPDRPTQSHLTHSSGLQQVEDQGSCIEGFPVQILLSRVRRFLFLLSFSLLTSFRSISPLVSLFFKSLLT